jgi:hypothetical protein
MRRQLTASCLLVLVFVLASCVSTRSIPYETTSRAPKPQDYPMEIVESAGLSRPYKVIGVVQANAGKLHSVKNTLEHLRTDARKMGGDALMDLEQGPVKKDLTGPFRNYRFEDSVREDWSAKVIVWTDNSQDNETQ